MNSNMKNVLEWLEKTATDYPDSVCYMSGTAEEENLCTLTFSEMITYSKAIGSVLATEKNSAPVAVFSAKCATTPALFEGVVYSGRAYAPIDAALPQARLEKILENLSPSVMLTDAQSYANLQKVVASLSSITCKHIYVVDFALKTIKTYDTNNFEKELSCQTLSSSSIDEARLTAIRSKMSTTDPLYIIYTSGSSGNPKGVMTSHLSLITYINAYTKVMGITGSDCLGNQSPLDYIAAIRDIYIPMKTGCKTVMIPKQYFMEPDVLFNYMNEKKVTSVGWSVSALTVPLTLGAFQEVKLTSLNKICFSGSVMPGSTLRVWQENLPDALFVNQYGPTEATASCTYYVVDHKVENDEVLPIGVAYDNYKVFLLPASEEELTDDMDISDIKSGEICVAGPVLALGYYNDRERTEKSFTLNPLNKAYPERIYRTGDIGSLDENGILHFHGRMDRQIKHMGHRVELDEIECAANALDTIGECCCIYKKAKEVLILYYTGDAEKKELTLELRKTLPGFMVPRKLIKLDEMPKLPNGKIDTKKLEDL